MDRHRIADAVADRHAELGKSWTRLAADADLDPATVWKVRSGQRVSDASLRKLDAGLGWPVGTLQTVGAGAPAPLGTGPDALVAILADIRDSLVGLAQHLGVTGNR